MFTGITRKSILMAGVAAAILTGGFAPHSRAEDPAPQAPTASPESIKLGDPVVAKVDGQEIKRSDVLAFIQNLPEQVRAMPIQNLFPMAQDQVITSKVIDSRAMAAKIEGDPEVTKLLDQAKSQIIRSVYVEREVAKQVSEKKLVKAYEDMLAQSADVMETHARHILVDSEEKAKEVIKKLDGGAKFEDLAKEYSSDGTSQNGGDLGYFTKDQMVPEFADAAFKIAPGQYSKQPVKSPFGWHVIKVEDRRKKPEPKFEDVKAQLESEQKQKAVGELVEQWRKEAKVQKFDMNGEPVKDAPAASDQKPKK